MDGITTWFLWDGDALLAEFDGTGARTRRYTYAGGFAPVEVADPTGPGTEAVYAVDTDHLDTPRLLTDATGAPVWRASTQAYGEAAVDPGSTVPFNLRFPGQYLDAETGLHYNRHRYYSPQLGRYISADPIGQLGGTNLFPYGGGDPLNWVDPLGLAPNQAGTTDPSTIANEMRNLSKPGTSTDGVLSQVAEQHLQNRDRYFYTDKYGWVDARHFAAAAALAYGANSSALAELLGFGNEALQWCTEWGSDYRSGFSPEDVPSNAAGAEFGDDYAGQGSSLENDFKRWLSDAGGRKQNDPAANRGSLPATDPSVRGGANRGSSNASSGNPAARSSR